MKSEVWVIVVIFTGSIGLLLMLARTLCRKRNMEVGNRCGITPACAWAERAHTVLTAGFLPCIREMAFRLAL